jgi:hypothetical protein
VPVRGGGKASIVTGMAVGATIRRQRKNETNVGRGTGLKLNLLDFGARRLGGLGGYKNLKSGSADPALREESPCSSRDQNCSKPTD